MPDQKDLTYWVDEFTDEMLNWAIYKTSDLEVAKDLVQETFVIAATKLDTFERKSSPKTWLMGILRHKIIDHYRAKVRKPIQQSQLENDHYFDNNEHWADSAKPNIWEEEDSQLLDNDDFLEILKQCIEALPEKWNFCIQAKYLMDKKGEDICQELEISPTNFWQIVHRSKLKLRECIENNWIEE